MSIKLLAPQLANQIAAGEVVERPASVVKELIENSIDAGATRIELDIERGGHKRIRIRDNGKGIPESELELALSRHATSKITSLDDLESILSLGFRGEALASISSVSRLTLTSKPADQSEAWQAHCEGRDMAVKLNPAAHPKGTSIDVADLFYNTPARRKFLRTEKTEFQHIEDVVKRIALSHPDIAFVLKHNDKLVRRYPSSNNATREQRIASVVGKKFVENAIYTQVDYDGITLEAWLGNEHALRSSTDCQFSFVNGRGMRDKLITHAIRQAYESAWGVVEQPAFVVYLTVSPRDVDVNVHPAKHEVRFQRSRLVHDFICKSVLDALMDTASRPASHTSRAQTPQHDYIRPLSHGDGGHPQPVNERTFSPPPTHSGGRPGSGPGVRRLNDSAEMAGASAGYQALMTPASNETGEVRGPTWISLDDQHRLYVKGDTAHLLAGSAVGAGWLCELFANASTSQPLLMPVAVDDTGVRDETLAMLQAQHFVVQRAAGKVRLQQVPAGSRHLPWTSWFGTLLAETEGGAASVRHKLASLASDLPDSGLREAWAWFENKPVDTQWEWICDSGKVQSVSTLIRLFE